MVRIFLDHSWKKWNRSVAFSKELATTFFLGFLTLMIGGYLLAFGFFLPAMLREWLQAPNPLDALHSFLLYYVLFDLVFRYLIQNIPVLDIKPYLHLPVKRSSIVHFLLMRSIVHPLNVFVILLFGPMAATYIAPNYGAITAWAWISGLWFLSLILHFLVMLFKVKLDDSFWGMVAIVFLASFFGLADYYNWFSMSEVSKQLFANAVDGLAFLIISLLLLVAVYVAGFIVFRNSIYPDEIAGRHESQYGQRDFGFLRSFGPTGEWINLELKLILRNKRPRTILFLSIFFLLYGLIFYRDPTYSEKMPGIFLFVGIFVTGVFMINYGQYLFSWQATHFDFNLTRPLSIRDLISSKYWLLGSVTVICFLITIPYVYFGWRILFINGAMTLFNLGVNSIVIMNLGMWSPKRLDLTKGGAFNLQGVGAAQWVMGLPTMVGPYVFYLPFSLAGYPMAGILCVAFVGLLGIVFRSYLINFTARRFLNKKHQIAEGFRND